MIDARTELAPNRTVAPPWPQRLALLCVFLANGLGIGSWAAAIPRIKADLALSDAGLSFALLAFAAGGIVAMPLTGLLAHRLRSGLASIVAGFAFAAAIAAIGFAPSLEMLCATAFLAGTTSGVMDVAMNANASDVERRSGRPLMSSFHAAFSLGAPWAHCWAVGSGQEEPLWVSWVPLCSRRCSSRSRLQSSCVKEAASTARDSPCPAGASCRSPCSPSC